MPPALDELNEEEGCLIGDSLDVLLGLARACRVLDAHSRTLDPEQLDRTWATWLATSEPGPAAAQVVQVFGFGLGDWLVRRHNFVWKAAETFTAEGSERQLTVLGQPGNMLMYPIEVVAERYLAGQQGFFAEVALQIEEIVGRAR